MGLLGAPSFFPLSPPAMDATTKAQTEQVEDIKDAPVQKSVLDGLSIPRAMRVFKKTSFFCALAAFSAMW